jgi:hypothetical protein
MVFARGECCVPAAIRGRAPLRETFWCACVFYLIGRALETAFTGAASNGRWDEKSRAPKRRSVMQKLFSLLALLAALAFLPSRLQAQETGNSGQNSEPSASAVSVTGCLQAGKKAGHFMLTADDGTIYHLRSRSVDLSEHVGHTVSVTGHVPQHKSQGGQAPPPSSSSSSAPTSGMQSGGGQEGGQGAHGGGHMLIVTDLKMVSDSCKQ